jgi:hypothetical protein
MCTISFVVDYTSTSPITSGTAKAVIQEVVTFLTSSNNKPVLISIHPRTFNYTFSHYGKLTATCINSYLT